MKKLIFFVILSIITLNLFSQEVKENRFGISFSMGQTGIYSGEKTVIGGPGYEGLTGWEVGLNYYHPLTKMLNLESGIYWHYNKIKEIPDYYPGMDLSSRYYNCNLFYVPLNLKVMLSKWFFVHGGLLLNIDTSISSPISNQTGLGTDFGFGIVIPVSSHFKISINPFLNIHGLLRLEKGSYPQSLIADGIRITFNIN